MMDAGIVNRGDRLEHGLTIGEIRHHFLERCDCRFVGFVGRSAMRILGLTIGTAVLPLQRASRLSISDLVVLLRAPARVNHCMTWLASIVGRRPNLPWPFNRRWRFGSSHNCFRRFACQSHVLRT
jgi:hypothetical protein